MTAELAAPFGGFACSRVRAKAGTLSLRAVAWQRDLGRLGVQLPLFLVHDVGLLFAAAPDHRDLRPLAGAEEVLASRPRFVELCRAYGALVDEIAKSDASRRAAALRLTDALVVVVLARVLEPVTRACPLSAVATPPFDLRALQQVEAQLGRWFDAAPREDEERVLAALLAARLSVLTLVDGLDLDTLRFFGLLGAEASAAGALAHVDLLSAFESPATHDIVHFSLELLPGILETTHARSAGLTPEEGYAGIGTRGSFDSLVLTELSWDDDELERRLVEGELLHYTRERASEAARRLHYVVIDASASMRGDRQIFARGLALALARKLHADGEDVWLRFFDSRLYDVQRTGTAAPVAYVLGFKGERGRNPGRVFAQLAVELGLLRSRETRDVVVHLITHAALRVPRAVAAELCRVAHVFGVFILPSRGAVDLDWLDLLDGHATVDHASLHGEERRAVASRIVGDAVRVARANSAGPRPAQPLRFAERPLLRPRVGPT